MPVTVVEFLNARLAEDEADAKAACKGPWRSSVEGRDHLSGSNVLLTGHGVDIYLAFGEDTSGNGWEHQDRTQDHVARHDPTRALEEIKAKQAIMSEAMDLAMADGWVAITGNAILYTLAQVYREHPDFDLAWRS